MTKVIYISGPSGSGKTTLARALVNRIEHSVMLDVDALWEQGDKEWIFDKSMKHLALINFETCLENCMRCDSIDVVIACGVLRGALARIWLRLFVGSLRMPISFRLRQMQRPWKPKLPCVSILEAFKPMLASWRSTRLPIR